MTTVDHKITNISVNKKSEKNRWKIFEVFTCFVGQILSSQTAQSGVWQSSLSHSPLEHSQQEAGQQPHSRQTVGQWQNL